VLDVLAAAESEPFFRQGWKLDSGATQHISNTTRGFSSFSSYGVPRVLQVGKAEVYLRALGEGTIVLKVPTGPGAGGSAVGDLILTHVWYCPDCPFNLISTRRVVQAGHSIKLTSTGAAILALNGELAVWLEMDKSGLYSCLGDASADPPGVAGVAVEGSTLPSGMSAYVSTDHCLSCP
jgi:hypothetical protein